MKETDVRSPHPHKSPITHPVWPETLIATGIYVLGIGALCYWMLRQPGDAGNFPITIAGAVNFGLGLAGFPAAYGLRVRSWKAFGFRPTTIGGVAICFLLGVIGFGLSFIVEAICCQFITEVNMR